MKLQEFNEAGNEGSSKCAAKRQKTEEAVIPNTDQAQKEQKEHYD